MLHDGRDGFQWRVLDAKPADGAVPENPREHVKSLLADFVDPMPRFLEHTDFNSQIFRWDVENHPSLQTYSKGHVVVVGDAAHPVSPYAAYGMGMAIEDGYFLTRYLKGKSLADKNVIDYALKEYNSDRVKYCNSNVENARDLGHRFHYASAPMGWLRDVFSTIHLFCKR